MRRAYRVQDRTRQKLNRLNKRVSNKKSRYRKEHGIELNSLYQTKKADDFTSRKELEKYVRRMEHFLKRDTQFVQNSKGVILERKFVKRFEREIERINKIKQKEYNRIKDLETQIKGKKLGMTVGERMKYGGSTVFPILVELSGSIDRFESQKQLEKDIKNRLQGKFFRKDFIRMSNIRYRQNFIESLETKIGSKSKRLQKHIKKMKLNDFMKVYYESVGTIDINYVYNKNDESDEELMIKLKNLELTFGI